tara:strand:- start:2067 stop:2543 length:477 start_codon:yes stop_codon:yes gene_type:complete
MEFLSNFQIAETYKSSSIDTKVLKNGKKQILYNEVLNLDKDNVDKYCVYYNRFFEDYRKQTESLSKRKLLLVYDLRKYTEDMSYYNQMKGLYTFISMHLNLRNYYEYKLVATVIIISNEKMEQFFDTIFTSLYTPIRPIKIVTDEKIQECLSTIYDTP